MYNFLTVKSLTVKSNNILFQHCEKLSKFTFAEIITNSVFMFVTLKTFSEILSKTFNDIISSFILFALKIYDFTFLLVYPLLLMKCEL